MTCDGRVEGTASPTTAESDTRSADGTASDDECRSRILLLVDRTANRRQLASWLSDRYPVETVGARSVAEAVGDCDLCIVDDASFARHRERLADRKEAVEPVFLPYLLVLTDGSRSRLDASVWDETDDVIETPVRKVELQGRIEVLLRTRRYSLTLDRQNRRLERFADVVAHELRNPLTIAQGFFEAARRDGDPDHFERVDRALVRMQEIVDDVLTLARTGTLVQRRTPVDAATAAERAWLTVDTRDASLEVEEGYTVLADESRLVELFENLFRNAVHHAGDDVSVRVGALSDAEGFYVEDDGPGIPERERERAFEYGRAGDGGGLGFGLSIVAGIVEAHDWSVRLTAGRDGGARVEVTCGPSDESAAADESTAGGGQRS